MNLRLCSNPTFSSGLVELKFPFYLHIAFYRLPTKCETFLHWETITGLGQELNRKALHSTEQTKRKALGKVISRK